MTKVARLAAIVVSSSLILVVPASATTMHKKLRCKHGYVAKVLTVKKHKHGRVVKAKVDKCVRKRKALIGTNGQSYQPALGVERKGCTDFDYGEFSLAPGAAETGCVVFELPEAVEVEKAQWDDGLEPIRTFGG